MGLDLSTGQHAATVLLDLSLAIAAGASASVLWLARGSSGWAARRLPRVRRVALAGVLVGLAASILVLCLEAAAMAEVPLAEAGPAVASMLSGTHYGLAWRIGAGALAVAAALVAFMPRAYARQAAVGMAGALAVFWYTRSMVSHAASQGDFSFPLLVDWLHLALVSLWVGECIVAGLVVLVAARDLEPADRRDRAAYVASLSSSATIGLAGIFATGLFSAWHNLGKPEDLTGNQYGNTLVLKLALVGVAALMGGFNRLVVMPPWLAGESTGRSAGVDLPRRFRRVLLAEAAVLLGVLVVAVVLAATSPP
jgi:putative copper resistance protein D